MSDASTAACGKNDATNTAASASGVEIVEPRARSADTRGSGRGIGNGIALGCGGGSGPTPDAQAAQTGSSAPSGAATMTHRGVAPQRAQRRLRCGVFMPRRKFKGDASEPAAAR